MNRELYSGETKASKPQCAAQAAALSWAAQHRGADNASFMGSKRGREERKMKRGSKLKSTWNRSRLWRCLFEVIFPGRFRVQVLMAQ